MIKLVGTIIIAVPANYAKSFIIKGIVDDIKNDITESNTTELDEDEDFIRTFLTEEEADDLIYNINHFKGE